MASLEEDAVALADFGFTYNEAKIYTAIVRLRSSSVGAISKTAKVRREHVYRTLPKLERMGLIERGIGTPSKIEAISVEEAFSKLIRRQQDEIDRRMSALVTQAKTFVDNFNRSVWKTVPEEDETQFCLVSEKDAVLGRTLALIKGAHEEIDMMVSRRKLTETIFFFGEFLQKAVRHGVRICVITEAPDDGDVLPRIIEEQISPGEMFELKYTDRPVSHFLIVDDKETMVAASTEASLEECAFLWTNNHSFLALVTKSFKESWRSSLNWARIASRQNPQKTTVSHSNVTRGQARGTRGLT